MNTKWNNEREKSQFPKQLQAHLTFAFMEGAWRFWKLKIPTPCDYKDTVLFSGTYERLDEEYLIPNSADFLHDQSSGTLFIAMVLRVANIIVSAIAIATIIKKGGFSPIFGIIFFQLFELINIILFLRSRLYFERRVCFSRKDNAVFMVDYQGNIHKTHWNDIVWYITYGHGIFCAKANPPPITSHKSLNPVYEDRISLLDNSKYLSYSDINQRAVGIYHFIHSYMEHGIESIKTVYAHDGVVKKGELPCGVTLLRPSPPFKPDKEFASTFDLMKDMIRRFILFPFWPPLLLHMRPQLRKFPFEEVVS